MVYCGAQVIRMQRVRNEAFFGFSNNLVPPPTPGTFALRESGRQLSEVVRGLLANYASGRLNTKASQIEPPEAAGSSG